MGLRPPKNGQKFTTSWYDPQWVLPFQRGNLGARKVAPFARREPIQPQVADPDSHQAQRWMPHRCCHTSHLTIAALAQCDFNPRRGHGFSEANRRVTRWELWFAVEQRNIRRQGPVALNRNAPS